MAVSTDALRQLHRIHKQLSDLGDRRVRGPKQVQAHEANVERNLGLVAKIQADIKAARVLADQKQLLLKSNEGKVADLKIKLNTAKTNREFQALKEQIAADEMAASVLADEILEGLVKVDELQLKLADSQEQLAKVRQELEKVRQNVERQRALIDGDVTRLKAELAQAEGGLPDEFRQPYERVVSQKGSDGMAEMEGASCGGCYQRITPNMQSNLSLGHVVICGNCGRLLYLAEDRSPGG